MPNRCSICKKSGHNYTTCLDNVQILKCRPGKSRRRCIRLHSKDSRRRRCVHLFDRGPNFFKLKKSKKSEAMMKRAKQTVFNLIDRLEDLVSREQISSFERAWFKASGCNKLIFDFGTMRKHLHTAHYGRKHLNKSDFGVNDNQKITVNMRMKFSQKMLEQLLFHEVLHWNIRRVSPGCKYLSEKIDHLAMAMLGDRDELSNMKLCWFDCVFRNCDHPKHVEK